jgi:hypothetical protein
MNKAEVCAPLFAARSMSRIYTGPVIATLLIGMSFVCRGQATDNIQPLSPNESARDVIARRLGPHLQTDAVQLQNLEWILPELILGGEWTTTIRLTNRGATSIPATNVYFMDNTGNPMTTTFQTTAGNVVTGPGFNFTLPVGAMVEATFLGGTNTLYGHAFVGCNTNGCLYANENQEEMAIAPWTCRNLPRHDH